MRTVHVKVQKPYDVLIERGLLEEAGRILLQTLGRTCKAAILTDDVVNALYGLQIENTLKKSGFEVCRFAMPHGEANKNLATWGTVLDFLAQNQLTRSDVIIALGGGVVGDMAGFAAASFLRGIPFMQIPTTLLSMVDSSVGGKTGLNLKAGKNLAGAFYQPCAVLCDPDTLWTLKPEQLAEGTAEVIKYGILDDEALFEQLQDGRWHDRMLDVIETCVAAKAKLVETDEHDHASRQLLNLGHTFGHAIEKCSDFEISHGYAVAVGMMYAARLSSRLGLCDEMTGRRIEAALLANHLPVEAPFQPEELHRAMLSDKKREGGTITFVLPLAIGKCERKEMAVLELPSLIAKVMQA